MSIDRIKLPGLRKIGPGYYYASNNGIDVEVRMEPAPGKKWLFTVTGGKFGTEVITSKPEYPGMRLARKAMVHFIESATFADGKWSEPTKRVFKK